MAFSRSRASLVLLPLFMLSGSIREVSAQGLKLNELMARNAETLKDTDGEYKDWFEVKNEGPASINLGGYYVTDDPTDLTKWRIPSTQLSSGGYLLVFASRKDRAITGRELHTNFTLDGDGENLTLVMPNGVTVVDSVTFGDQRSDYSYGRSGASMMFFANPTPRSSNGAGVPGFVGETVIQGKRGLHTTRQTVAITCATAGATIRYTLDGSTPTSTTGAPYGSPLQIDRTTVIRAAAFASGLGPSLIDSRTFVFIDDVLLQPDSPPGFPRTWGNATADYGMDPAIVNATPYRQTVKDGLQAIPILSISLPMAEMFGSNGIYSNPTRKGRAWERLASTEYFDPASGSEFHTSAGVRIQGGASRNPGSSPKHSLSLRFRDAYRGDLKFAMFSGSPIRRFDSIHLRAVYNNSWIHWDSGQRRRGMLIRDQWMRDMLLEMGQEDAGHGGYVSLFINGLFWGVYNVHERQEAAHYAAWNGGAAHDYDARNGSSFVDGDSAAWSAMHSAVQARDWTTIQQTLALENYIDWTIVNRFGGNSDLKISGNWRAAGGGPGASPWRFYSWDAERVLESENRNNNPPDPPGLLTHLQGIPEFVVLFGDRLHRHFFHDGALTTTRTAARFSKRTTQLDTAIVVESARWGDYRRDVHSSRNGPYELYTRNDHWIPERDRLTGTYFPRRSSVVLNQYKNLSLYPSLAAPAFNQHGGTVQSGFPCVMSAPSGTIYFTLDGSDPRAPGGAVSAAATTYSSPVTLLSSTTVRARTRSGSNWSALNEARFLIESITINEFLAKNSTGLRDNFGDRDDWIELHNKNSNPVAIGGMYLTDSSADPKKWKLPSPTILQPGGSLIIWADDEPNQGPHHATFRLAVGGEEILLFDIDGKTLLDEITFGPQLADISTGRLHDGTPLLVTFPTPTPGNPNSIAVCGDRRYSSLDPTTQTLDLDLIGVPGIGKQVTIQASGGPSTGDLALIGGFEAGDLPFLGTARLMIQGRIWLLGVANPTANGSADFPLPIPALPSLIGDSAYLQAWAWNAGPWQGSVGLEIKFCQ